jgi:hypothetical protein
MFGPPTVELRFLFGAERELRFALGVGETLPESQSQVRSLVRRELEQLRIEGTAMTRSSHADPSSARGWIYTQHED